MLPPLPTMTSTASIHKVDDLIAAYAHPRFALSRAYQVLIVMRATEAVGIPLTVLRAGDGTAFQAPIGLFNERGGYGKVEHVVRELLPRRFRFGVIGACETRRVFPVDFRWRVDSVIFVTDISYHSR